MPSSLLSTSDILGGYSQSLSHGREHPASFFNNPNRYESDDEYSASPGTVGSTSVGQTSVYRTSGFNDPSVAVVSAHIHSAFPYTHIDSEAYTR